MRIAAVASRCSKSEDPAGSVSVAGSVSTECPVCLVNFEPGDQVVPLTCNIDHVFHIECLLSWADHNYTCPICRQPIISSQEEIALYEMMQQPNQFNQHEDALGSGVLPSLDVGAIAEAEGQDAIADRREEAIASV